ncbi:30S ribosomal protein S4 [Candidatus Wolfebacteria bacterium]|nr:30S ribosomal protein S4 [Candidatus Wolfebacteria bacterium]
MLIHAKEKKERSLGIRLGLKAHRCNSPKCVMIRRPYRPGEHGKARRRAPSEFGSQLSEKQKLMTTYILRDRALEKIFIKALRASGAVGDTVLAFLERRLDNVVFRLGLAPSRIVARQVIGHGHIFVNGKKVTVPSYETKVGDVISIRPLSINLLPFRDLRDTLKKYEPPVWFSFDIENLSGKVLSLPRDIEQPFDINLVVDYYSK